MSDYAEDKLACADVIENLQSLRLSKLAKLQIAQRKEQTSAAIATCNLAMGVLDNGGVHQTLCQHIEVD